MGNSKRSRTTGPSPVPSDTAKPSRLTRMPPELQDMCFENLLPADLLAVGRCSKTLKMHLDNACSVIWRRTFANINGLHNHMPPTSMNQAVFASLAFETDCQGCGLPFLPPDRTLWVYRRRYCQTCENNRTVQYRIGSPEEKGLMDALGITSLGDVLPHSDSHRYLRSDVDALNEEATKHAQDAEAWENALARWTQFTKYLKEKREHWDKWLQKWRKDIIKKRVDEIVLHLRHLGFSQEITYLGSKREALVDHPCGGIPCILTPREWSRIKPQFAEWMEDRRKRRRLWVSREACLRRLTTYDNAMGIAFQMTPPHANLPLPLDVAKYPEIGAIMSLGGAAYVPVTAYAELLLHLIERWATEAKASLSALVAPSSTPIVAPTSYHSTRQATRDELSLARSVFRCRACWGTFHARELYAHPCLYGQAVDVGGMLPNAAPLTDGILPRFECSAVESARLIHYDGYQPWSTSALRYYGNVAEHIIRLCDKDASVARIADLENCATRLVCRICSVRRRRVLVMNWLCAIDHIIDVHPSRLHDALQKAPMDVSIAARQLDQAYESRMQREQVDTLGWECSRCLFGRLQWLGRADVMAHMQSKHGTASDFDCHQRADARRPESMPVLLLANALKHTEDHDAWEREWMWHHRRRFGYTDLRQGGLEEV